ncbi:MarR family winged helix-turn-helix transcriptional regulator [Microvirga sp. GCM10011540]|uniref:MarR family winged helix-turn-helix transcriptional regulator n=1 Tax=Microvirga sp. GCM10011540 TaxID=3317338 RepID=UPI003622E6F8
MSTKKTAAVSAEDSLQLSSQLCFATYAAAHAFNRFYKPLLDPFGLTYPQYLVMLVLWERENVTVKDIGQRLHLDSGTLTPLLKRLETAGLVRRTRDTHDERQVRIDLTQRGRDLKAPVAAVWRDVVCATGLAMDELDALKDQLNTLRRSLNEAAESKRPAEG